MTLRHGLEIRAAIPADAPTLAELLALPAATIATRLDSFRQAPGTILIAREWGPPSGIIAVTWHPTLTQDRPTALITTLLVAPDARRRGIARLLLKAAAQAARNAGADAIEIATTHPDLEAFCAATGFLPAGPHVTRPLRRHP